MKARVKATGEIWTFSQIDEITFKSAINGHLYCAEELEFVEPSAFSPDYWEKLKHQYAGMAMQVVLEKSYNELYHTNIMKNWSRDGAEGVARLSVIYATALVEKLKKDSNGLE